MPPSRGAAAGGHALAQATPPEEVFAAVAEEAGALDELCEIARGVHPAILAERGLPTALKALARRSPIPVDLQVQVDERPPEPAEVSACYVNADPQVKVIATS